MADTVIISLISEQAVPNIIFFRWCLENKIITGETDLLFISTSEMKKRVKIPNYLDALFVRKYPYDSVHMITVESSSVNNICEKLDKYLIEHPHKKVIANITGGTKIMSLGLYKFCGTIVNASVYYQAFSGELMKIYPTEEKISNDVYLTLNEYLKAYGIGYNSDEKCLKDINANKQFCKYIKEYSNGLKAIVQLSCKNLDGTQNYENMKFNKKLLSSDDIENGRKLISFCDFDSTALKSNEIFYITGGWFEELVYQLIKKTYNLDSDRIKLNLKISLNNVNNEFDVVYIDKSNAMNVIECKALVQNQGPNKIIDNAIYKLQALKHDFGLKVNGYIFTNATITNPKLLERAKSFGLKIISLSDFQKNC